MPKSRTTPVYIVRNGKIVSASLNKGVKPKPRKRKTMAEALAILRGIDVTETVRDDVANMKYYPGFANIPALLYALKDKGMDATQFHIVGFNKQFYGVGFESLNKAMVIGADRVWFRNKGYFVNADLSSFMAPYPILKRREQDSRSKSLEDMQAIDPNLSVSTIESGKVSSVSIPKVSYCVVLLASTFHHEFYSRSGIQTLHRYFSPRELQGFAALFDWQNSDADAIVTGINPFKCYARVMHKGETLMVKVRARLKRSPHGRKFSGFEMEPFWEPKQKNEQEQPKRPA